MLAAALAVVAACKPAEPAGNALHALPPPAPQRAAPVTPDALFGQWQLVRLGGAALPEGAAIHLLVGHSGVEAVSQCVAFGFRLPGQPPPPRFPSIPVQPVCARALSPAEERFSAVVNPILRMERRAGGQVALIGEEGEAVIARPASPVTNPFANAPRPDPRLMWGAWHVAAADGRPVGGGERIEILFGRRAVDGRSGCVPMHWAHEQQGETLTFARLAAPVPVCERGLSEAERGVERVFSGHVRIARSTATERLLVGAGGTVLLRR